jgi:hypothetical protein
MSKLQDLANKAQTLIKTADEQAVPLNLAELARLYAEFTAETVATLQAVGAIPAPAEGETSQAQA